MSKERLYAENRRLVKEFNEHYHNRLGYKGVAVTEKKFGGFRISPYGMEHISTIEQENQWLERMIEFLKPCKTQQDVDHSWTKVQDKIHGRE